MQKFTLTPTNPMASFSTTITAPGQGNHNPMMYDLDVSGFASGGTITITGVVAAGGCAASSYLAPQCYEFPATGSIPGLVGVADDVPAGQSWKITYQFTPTDVLHFGTEGNWSSAAGTTNTEMVAVSVSP